MLKKYLKNLLSNKTKKIGVYGGSFNPPHISHKAIIDGCIKAGIVDEVWIIPSNNHTQKNNNVSFYHRVNMCKIMFKRLFHPVKVKNDDLHNHSGRTLDLMYILNFKYNRTNYERQNKKYEFYIIIGEDCADNIESWCEWKRLISEYKFIVVKRNDYFRYDSKDWYKKNPHKFISLDGCWFSSTYLRGMLSKGHLNLASMLTSPKIVRYVTKKSLYVQEKQ